jgi:hypothetical protein
MSRVLACLEEFFTGTISPETALATVSQISGKYKMEVEG